MSRKNKKQRVSVKELFENYLGETQQFDEEGNNKSVTFYNNRDVKILRLAEYALLAVTGIVALIALIAKTVPMGIVYLILLSALICGIVEIIVASSKKLHENDALRKNDSEES